jgi:CRP/FNR family transcriptional regulator
MLSMSRTQIANYLGAAPETISRKFSLLQRMGLISTQGKHIQIDDRYARESGQLSAST